MTATIKAGTFIPRCNLKSPSPVRSHQKPKAAKIEFTNGFPDIMKPITASPNVKQASAV